MEEVYPGFVRLGKPCSGDGSVRLSGAEFAELLDLTLQLGARWKSRRSPVIGWLKGLFTTPFILADVEYVLRPVGLGEVFHRWQEFMWGQGLAYHGETFDCDDFSSLFSSMAAEWWDTNAFPRVWGELCFPGGECYGHGFNVVVTAAGCRGGESYALVAGFEPQIPAIGLLRPDGTFDIWLGTDYRLHYIPEVVLAW